MKDMKRKLILISFVLAVMSAGTVFAYLQSLNKSKETIKEVKIFVANEIIPPRTLIDKKMIKEIVVPDNSIISSYLNNIDQIVGKYSKETILKGEGFYADKIIDQKEDSNELSLKIDSDHRAISINVTGDSGVSNLIKPGDYVDIIVYLSEKKDGDKVVRPDQAEVIMQNVEVLAIDKILNRDDKNKDEDKIPTSFLVTISAPIKDMEKVVLAEDIGSIKLALRANRDEKLIPSEIVTEKELLEPTANDNIKPVIKKETMKNPISFKYYKIKTGDTLKKISRYYYGNSDDYVLIKEANRFVNENYIEVGRTIKVPILTQQR